MRKRTSFVGGVVMITVVVSFSAVCAGEQVLPPEAASPHLSPEVSELLQGTTFIVDPDEPVEAVKAYVETMKKLPQALGRIRLGSNPDQPDIDPDRILRDALGVMRTAAARYPTSRHTWQGVGDVLWLQYEWRHKAQDLREAVDAYMKTIDLTLPRRDDGRDFSYVARRISQGLTLLKEPQALDAFMRKLEAADQKFRTTTFHGQALGEYTEALARLKDPRADQLYQEMLSGVKPNVFSFKYYVGYLFDNGRYQEALQLLEKIPPSEIRSPVESRLLHIMKGATLERLGRLDEAKAEYQTYRDAVAAVKGTWFYAFPADEKFRIPGSVLQQGIEFGPDPNELPEPQSSTLGSWLLGGLFPTLAWAEVRATPCASNDRSDRRTGRIFTYACARDHIITP